MFGEEKRRDPYSRKEQRYRRLYEESGGERNSDFRHSTYYHSYFHNYSERYRRTGPDGRKRLERVYEGMLFQVCWPDSKCMRAKLLLLLLYLGSAGLFLWGMSTERGGYTVALTAIIVVGYVLWAPVMLEYLFRKKQMTEFEYRSTHGRQLWFSQGIAVAAALCAVLEGTNIPGHPSDFFAVLGAAALAGGIHLLERGTPYEEAKNPNRAGDEATLIQ